MEILIVNLCDLFLKICMVLSGLLDAYLAHKESAAVVVNCAQLFVQLIENGYPHLEKDVIARSVPALTSFLGSSDIHAQG